MRMVAELSTTVASRSTGQEVPRLCSDHPAQGPLACGGATRGRAAGGSLLGEPAVVAPGVDGPRPRAVGPGRRGGCDRRAPRRWQLPRRLPVAALRGPEAGNV